MTDTRTGGADVGKTAETPRVGSGPAGSAAEDTSVRPAWRTKVKSRLAGAVEEHRDNAKAPTAAAAPGPALTPSPPAAAPAHPPSARPATKRARGPRKARLRLTRIDPWSVMKTAFLLSIAFAVVTVVSVTIVWSVLGAAGVWDSVNASIQQVVGGQDTNNFDIEDYVGMSRVLGFTMLIAVLDVVLITAMATLAAFLYNLSAALLGGVEVTLAEDGR